MRFELFLAFLILFSCMVGGARGSSDCKQLDTLTESEYVTLIQRTDTDFFFRCFVRDEVSQDIERSFQMVYELVARMKGLPKPLLDKWNNLRRAEIQMFATDLTLCLQNQKGDCGSSSELVAKNYRLHGEGLILVNRSKWEALCEEEKFSLIWHEVLSVLGFERNSYAYSSLVQFSKECKSTQTPQHFEQRCSIVAHLMDRTLLK